MIDKNKLKFNVIDIKDIKKYEITIFMSDKKEIIDEDTLIEKIQNIINLVVKKDLTKEDIKYCIVNFDEFKSKFHNVKNEDFIIYITSKDERIHISSEEGEI